MSVQFCWKNDVWKCRCMCVYKCLVPSQYSIWTHCCVADAHFVIVEHKVNSSCSKQSFHVSRNSISCPSTACHYTASCKQLISRIGETESGREEGWKLIQSERGEIKVHVNTYGQCKNRKSSILGHDVLQCVTKSMYMHFQSHRITSQNIVNQP